MGNGQSEEWWGDKRYRVTFDKEGNATEAVEWEKPVHPRDWNYQGRNGVRIRMSGQPRHTRNLCLDKQEYIVWAKDELEAFMVALKLYRGEKGNPFGEANPFDA